MVSFENIQVEVKRTTRAVSLRQRRACAYEPAVCPQCHPLPTLPPCHLFSPKIISLYFSGQNFRPKFPPTCLKFWPEILAQKFPSPLQGAIFIFAYQNFPPKTTYPFTRDFNHFCVPNSFPPSYCAFTLCEGNNSPFSTE